ncbi:unnamed protein product [Adineta steineri]|uniref:Uncharacterized protein n=1 Tax=Adineta steineri TaxID=433720 RepID=A0A819JP86_9BILA|nr:unnamed protein product [Adineta steineri]CAF3936403.1 unnamed protein product [Adineta steineri]
MNFLHFIHLILSLICFILIFSTNIVSSKSCLLSNTSYALCSVSDKHPPIIKSELFHEHDFNSKCHDLAEEILNKSCHESHKPTPPTSLEKYGYGFLAVFTVSALPLAGLLAFPMLYKVSFQYVLTLFTALAVGTLFGDTMFHLIPLALDLHGGHGHHDHHDDHGHTSFSVPKYVWKMLTSVLILYSFYLLEVLLHSFAHYKHKNANSVHFHAHGHSHAIPHHNHSHPDGEVCEHTPLDIDADLEHSHRLHNHMHHNLHQHVSNEISTGSSLSAANQNFHNNSTNKNVTCVPCAYSNDVRPTTSLLKHDSKGNLKDTDDHTPVTVVVKSSQDTTDLKNTNPVIQKIKTIKSTGWMVLIGDGIHNFADGLAIGAAFSQDLILGMTTTLAIAFHELPHELGDYAVLIQSGFTHYRAVLWNFLSATTAIIGFFIGAALSSNDDVRQWIFAVTIGMFLYIALVDLLPTLLADGQVEFKRFIVVNIGFLLGIVIMFLLALFEDSIIRSSR